MTPKEADNIYRLKAMKAEYKYNKECKEAWDRKEKALTRAAKKRMNTKTT